MASLVLSKHPELSGHEVARILKQSATDIDTPGLDQYSGYGLVNAVAALDASPDFFIHSMIDNVKVIQGTSGAELEITGTANADSFKNASVAIGAGEDPSNWKNVIQVRQSIENNVLGTIPAKEFAGAKVWIIRLETEHGLGIKREFRFRLAVD